jgi:Protein of unknown function (DUF3277)
VLKKYNPRKINGGWNGIPFLGYMDGTFIDIEFAEDAVTTHVGSQGDVSVVLNANRMATVTVTLIQGSPTNEKLSKLVPDARRNSCPTGAFSLTDLNGTTLVSGKDAFIRKTAKVEFAKNITGRQWVFIIPEADIFVGTGGD